MSNPSSTSLPPPSSLLQVLVKRELGLVASQPQSPRGRDQCGENPPGLLELVIKGKEEVIFFCSFFGFVFSWLFHHQHIEASITARGTAANKVLLLGSFFGWITRRHAWDGTESEHIWEKEKFLFGSCCETSELGKYGRYLDAGKQKVKSPGAENPENKNRFLERHFL